MGVDIINLLSSLKEPLLFFSHCHDSFPMAKFHSIDHYIGCIGHYLTDPTRDSLTSTALIMTDLTLRFASITLRVKTQVRVEMATPRPPGK